MRIRIRSPVILLAALVLVAAVLATGAQAENIDPIADGSQYAWSENAGWINAEPANCANCGVEVSSAGLTGWMWGENIGWVSLSCTNTSTCGSVNYGVTNDGSGTLAGYAWAENVGWINFSCTNNGTCGATSYGVTIDTVTGEFSGFAWAENVGWINLSCATPPDTCGTLDYGVRTAWTTGGAKLAFPGDTDGDGCADVNENLPKSEVANGGGRDWQNPWDYYDVNGDGVINLFGDILGVITHFSLDGLAPYDATFDRDKAPPGANPWEMTAPDGVINLFTDILGVISQFTLTGCT